VTITTEQRKLRVALADDHAVVRDGLRFALEGGLDVEVVAEAADVAGAMAILSSSKPPDVLVLDLRLGDSSGLDVLAEAARRSLPTRILVMSMHDEPTVVRHALKLGAAGYLLKSAGRGELLRAIAAVSEGGRYVQGELAMGLAGEDERAATVTPREREVLALVADGFENRQIAKAMGISEETVKSYLKNLFTRWDLGSRAEAVAVALRLGVID
jgi:DNA-binding NarL/FixJ family response regulator